MGEKKDHSVGSQQEKEKKENNLTSKNDKKKHK